MGLAMYHVGFFQLDVKFEASFMENSIGFGLGWGGGVVFCIFFFFLIDKLCGS